LMDEYDVDGVYLDSDTILWNGCANLTHGCGYIAPDGRVVPTYPVFANREFMKRIYTMVKTRKPDGQVSLHQSGYMCPGLAWATSYLDVEHVYSRQGEFLLDRLPLDMFATCFMGHQWGVPASTVWHSLRRSASFTQQHALTLLHDVLVTGSFPALWRVSDDFGRKESRWRPALKAGRFFYRWRMHS